MRALLLSALMTTPDAGLEAFGAARAAGVDTWQLRRVRDILDALGKRLEGEAALDDPIMEAWSLLCPGQKDAAAPDDAVAPGGWASGVRLGGS